MRISKRIMWIISKSHRENFFFDIFAIHLSSRHEKGCFFAYWMALKWYKFQFFHVGIKLDLFYHIKHKNSIKLYIFIDVMYIYLAVLLPKNLVNGEVSKSARIWLSKSIFCIKNYLNHSHSHSYFFYCRISI